MAKRTANVARDIKIQTRGMDRKMQLLSKWSAQSMSSIVRDASRVFMESAQKYTPPNAGRTAIKAADMKRRVIVGTRMRGRFQDPEANQKWSYGSLRYKVPFRTSKTHGVKYFKTLKEAKSFAEIWFRGIARMGFYMGLTALGFMIPLSYRRGVRAGEMGTYVNSMRVNLKGLTPSVIITNRAKNISRFALYAKVIGLRRANAMLGFLVRKAKADLKARAAA